MAINLLLNFGLYHVLMHVHRAFPLGKLQKQHVEDAFNRAMTLIRYSPGGPRRPILLSDEVDVE